MKKVQKKPGRPATRPEKFPEQARRMEKVYSYLEESGQVKNREELITLLDIDRKTFTNWITGQTEISKLVKFTFSHLFQIQEEFWDAPEDALVEEYLGKPSRPAVSPHKLPNREDLEDLQRILITEAAEWARVRLGIGGEKSTTDVWPIAPSRKK